MDKPFMTPPDLRRMLRPEKWLTPGDLPPYLLDHLDAVWSRRAPVGYGVSLPPELADFPEALDEAERHVVVGLGEVLVTKSFTMLTSSGPRWFALPAGVQPMSYGKPTPGEVASTRDSLPTLASQAWLLVVRITGLAVPQYQEA